MKLCLILCDSLRYDRVNTVTMPFLSKLAEKGVSMSQFHAAGGTTKWSMPHYLSGQREFDPHRSFPKTLTSNQVKNVIIHSNAVLVNENHQNCFMHHKDVGVEMAPTQIRARNLLRNTELWKLTRGIRKALKGTITIPYRRAENIFKSAQRQLDLYDRGFYWIHLMDPHIPYVSPSLNDVEKRRAEVLYEKILAKANITDEEAEELSRFYDAECHYMDMEIGKFVDANHDTVFIVTSDHGEMFGETGSYNHGPYYHGMTPQLSHVPFIVHGLNVKTGVNHKYHSSIEVGSTILDLFGIDKQNGYGRSFKKEIMK